MTLILDSGALIAFERQQPAAVRLLERAYGEGISWRTHGGVVGQVWRAPQRQVGLGKLLRSTEILPLDAALGRDAGRLMAESATSDVIDAALVLLARDGDEIATSDPRDIAHLAEVAGLAIDLRVI